MGKFCVSQGAQTRDLWQPRGVGLDGRWDRTYYTCGWLILIHDRNQHNIVKQLYSNKKIFNYVCKYIKFSGKKFHGFHQLLPLAFHLTSNVIKEKLKNQPPTRFFCFWQPNKPRIFSTIWKKNIKYELWISFKTLFPLYYWLQ